MTCKKKQQEKIEDGMKMNLRTAKIAHRSCASPDFRRFICTRNIHIQWNHSEKERDSNHNHESAQVYGE